GGRVYDPNLGRFLSVDPLIQSTTSTQSQNAYSYVMNNPLSSIDPSGYATCMLSGDGGCLEVGSNDIYNDAGDYVGTIVVKNGKEGNKGSPAKGSDDTSNAKSKSESDTGKVRFVKKNLSVKDETLELARNTWVDIRDNGPEPISDMLVGIEESAYQTTILVNEERQNEVNRRDHVNSVIGIGSDATMHFDPLHLINDVGQELLPDEVLVHESKHVVDVISGRGDKPEPMERSATIVENYYRQARNNGGMIGIGERNTYSRRYEIPTWKRTPMVMPDLSSTPKILPQWAPFPHKDEMRQKQQ
ncbi:MAG TPA: RHS repeat-associated core domain-containing protein, partial [Pseudoxanthomonas sp.]